jgi:predicted RNase H-like nuclease (RuvC/YqgF family)
VVEHGSAVIQEKHISLLKEQFAILERENEALKKEIMQLKKRIKSDEQPLDNNLLHEIEIKVLLYLSSNSGRNTKQISKALNIAEEIIKLHTGILKTKSMIASGDDPADDDIWSLDLAGRQYLIENDLIEHESIS